VREQLRRIGHLDDAVVQPIVGAADRGGTAITSAFDRQEVGRRWVHHRRGRGLLKVEHCPIADPWVNDLLPRLQVAGPGCTRSRCGTARRQTARSCSRKIPGLEAETGQKAYIEELDGRRFAVSASAFFQVNSAQAEQMVRLVARHCRARRAAGRRVRGVGTFAVIFADRFKDVIAIEESHSAAKDRS